MERIFNRWRQIFRHDKTIFRSMPILLAQIFYKLIAIIVLIFITRKYTPSEVGVYLFAFSFTELFMAIVNFGAPNLLMREVSKDLKQTSDFLGNVFGLSLFCSCLCLIIIFCLTFIFFRQAVLMAVLVSISLILHQITENFSAVFFAHKKIKYAVFSGTTSKVFFIILFILFIQMQLHLIYLAAIHVLSSLYLFLVSFYLERKNITPFSVKKTYKVWTQILKNCFPFFLIAISYRIYFKIDVIMITKLKDFSEAAFYEVPLKIITAVLFIPYAFTPVLYPKLSRLFGKKKDFRTEYISVRNQLLAISCSLTIFFFVFAKPVVQHLFGGSFLNSWKALAVLSLALPFMFLRYLGTVVLFAAGKEKHAVLLILMSLTVKIILNRIFIPSYGFLAAAITTFFTEILFIIALKFSLHKSELKLYE